MNMYQDWTAVTQTSQVTLHDLVEPLASLVSDLRAEGRLEVAPVGRRAVVLRTKDQDLATCGAVRFEDMRRRATGADKPAFHVFSERIRNPRFSSSSDRYNSRSAKDVSKARTLVDQYIQPLSARALCKFTTTRFVNALRDAERPLKDAIGAASRPFIGYGTPNDTLVRLLLEVTSSSQLDTFTDAAQLREWREAYDAYDQPEYQQATLWFIHKRPLGYMARKLELTHKDRSYPSVVDNGDTQLFAENELPDVLQQRINVMQMLDVEQYVPGVGMRLSSNVWYAYA